MQEQIFKHFNSEVHTGFLDISITFIDKTDSQNPEKRENCRIHTLKTMVPWGIDILNIVWATLFGFTGFLGHGTH